MRILVVHPVMGLLGGGERLCCETIRTLLSHGHEITLLTEDFNPAAVESFFGYEELFSKVSLALYPTPRNKAAFGTATHILSHFRGQSRVLGRLRAFDNNKFDLMFSSKDPAYFPDVKLPVIQWGYFPRYFHRDFGKSLLKALRTLPLRLYYQRKILRIGLVLAISNYSKSHLDSVWKRPSTLVYPGCNMISARAKRDVVVTVSRASPGKRLEIFWEVARLCSSYEFVMLLTQTEGTSEYFRRLSQQCPPNGTLIVNPDKKMYDQIVGEAKVYLHLMEGEHFGISVVEAMSAGCVPIVHDSGGPREIVQDGVGYRWRKVEEIPAMVDRGIRTSPSEPAAKRARDFSVDSFQRRLSSVFFALRG